MPKKNYFEAVAYSNFESTGPFECPLCGGHVELDASFIDQVSATVTCPYCGKRVTVPEEWAGV